MLDDGTYDAFVVDVEVGAPASGTGGDTATTLELTIVAGAHKGEVLRLTTNDDLGDEVALIGMPATLTVTAGVPTVRIDR